MTGRTVDLTINLTSYNLPSIKLDRKFDRSVLNIDEVIVPEDLDDHEKYDLLVVSGNSLSLSVNMNKDRVLGYVSAWRKGNNKSDIYISPKHRRKTKWH